MIRQPIFRQHIVSRWNRAWVSDCRGVCLAELMVAMTAGVIVLAAILQTFNIVHAQAVRQQRMVARQQDLRLGLEVFEQEVRLATPSSIVKALPDEVNFLANVNLLVTNLTAPVLPGQTTLAVQDGSGWSAGKTVTLCGPVTCESRRLARDGQRSLLTLAEPISLALPIGASVEAANRISYYIRRDETGAVRLMRMVDGGASTVIGDLKAAQFAYRDSEDRPTTVTAQVRRIVAVIAAAHSSAVVVRDVGLRS